MPTFPGSASRQSASVAGRSSHAGQVVAAVDADHARRMRRRRHLGEQPRLDVLARAQQVDRLRRRGLDGVLALDEEEPELVAPAALVQLADGTSYAVSRGAGLAKPPAPTAV